MNHKRIRMQSQPAPSWRYGSFEGARAHVREIGRTMSFRDKILWLEEAETIARRFRVAKSGQQPVIPKP